MTVLIQFNFWPAVYFSSKTPALPFRIIFDNSTFDRPCTFIPKPPSLPFRIIFWRQCYLKLDFGPTTNTTSKTSIFRPYPPIFIFVLCKFYCWPAVYILGLLLLYGRQFSLSISYLFFLLFDIYFLFKVNFLIFVHIFTSLFSKLFSINFLLTSPIRLLITKNDIMLNRYLERQKYFTCWKKTNQSPFYIRQLLPKKRICFSKYLVLFYCIYILFCVVVHFLDVYIIYICTVSF